MPFGQIIQRITPSIFAGRLRHRIDIVAPPTSNPQDSAGGVDPVNDVVFANVWASIEALSGTEKFAAHEFTSLVSHQIVIRYMTGITAKMNVWFQNRTFQIEAVLNADERNKSLILLCIEINDAAQQVNPNIPSDLN